jgi:O-antigen ligase
MTTLAANPVRPMPPPRTAIRTPFPYTTIFLLVLAAIFFGIVAYFNQIAAAVLYAPFYLILCWFQPQIAVWLMFLWVAFPFNISGGETVHTAPAEISLCLAFPVFWLKSLISRRPPVSNPILIPVAIYFFICVASTFVHWSGRDAIISILQMVLYLVLTVKMFASFVDRRQIMYGIWGLIVACTCVSLYLVLTRSDDVLGVHKNATGTFLSYVVIIMAELYLAAVYGSRGKKWIGALLFINTAGLVMSTSRGAWLGAMAGLGILLLARRQFRLFGRGLILMIPAIAIVWAIMPAEQREYALDFSTSARNVGARVDTIQFFKDQFLQSPLLGMGVGLRKEADSTNIVMSTLAETGVLGLISFMLIQIVFFWTIFTSMKWASRAHPDFSFLALGPALVACLFVHGLADHYWSRTQLPVWAMAGAALAVRAAQRRMMRQAQMNQACPAVLR